MMKLTKQELRAIIKRHDWNKFVEIQDQMDMDLAKYAVDIDLESLSFLREDFIQNKEFYMYALTKKPMDVWNIKSHFDRENPFKNDFEVNMFIALVLEGDGIMQVNPAFETNPTYMYQMSLNETYYFENLKEELFSVDFISRIIKKKPERLWYLDTDKPVYNFIKNNKELMKVAIDIHALYLVFGSDAIRNDTEMVEYAISKNKQALFLVGEELKKNMEFMGKMIDKYNITPESLCPRIEDTSNYKMKDILKYVNDEFVDDLIDLDYDVEGFKELEEYLQYKNR